VDEPGGDADLLGINPSTLRNQMRKQGINYRLISIKIINFKKKKIIVAMETIIYYISIQGN